MRKIKVFQFKKKKVKKKYELLNTAWFISY